MSNEYKVKSSRSGLTGSKVLDIRRMYHEELYNDTYLAKVFKVSRKTIYNIVNNITWRHIPDPVTISGFKNYVLYPDGRVYSRAQETFLKPEKRSTGSFVRLTGNNGKRKNINVDELVSTYFGTVEEVSKAA